MVTSAPDWLVLLEHELVVHLVDVIAGEKKHVLGTLAADGIDVLVDGIGGSLVPVLTDALHGRKNFDELAKLAGDHLPGLADVAIEGERLVLGEDVDLAQVGVDAVGKGYVNNAVDAAKGDSGLGAVAGQRIKPLACTTS